MRQKYFFIIAVWFCTLTELWAQEDSIITVTPTSWERTITNKLQEVMKQADRDHYFTGLCVYDLTDGKTLFGHNQNKMMRPASTQKLTTAIAALDRLGAEHTYSTHIYRTGTVTTDSLGKKTLGGDIYITGDFDPLLRMTDFQEMVSLLKTDSITTINGKIYADVSMKDTLLLGMGWCWDDKNPLLTPLMLQGDASTSSISRIGYYHPEKYLTQGVVDLLRKNGIKVTTNTSTGVATYKGGGKLILTLKHTVDDVLLSMMKKSNNKHAESMFFQLGNETGKHCSTKDCISQVMQTVRKAVAVFTSVSVSDADVADGSGLSLYNYATPRMEVALLAYAFKHTNIYDYLYPSLPIAGVDGTLSHRMQQGSAYNNVHAKTGTVTGVSCLAGYAKASNGHMLAFSIMNNGVKETSQAHALQDKICNIITK